jgi:hypothetical protein
MAPILAVLCAGTYEAPHWNTPALARLATCASGLADARAVAVQVQMSLPDTTSVNVISAA